MSSCSEYSYPIIIHRYSLIDDSGGAGKFRGGSGTAWEVEPLDHEMTFITFGEGRRIPAMGAAGAVSKMVEARSAASRSGAASKCRDDPQEHYREAQAGRDGHQHQSRRRRLRQSLRAPDRQDRRGRAQRAGLGRGAREDYGVVIKNPKTLEVDLAATKELRGAALAAPATRRPRISDAHQISPRHRRRRHLHRLRPRRRDGRRAPLQGAFDAGRSDPGDRGRPEADRRRSRRDARRDRLRIAISASTARRSASTR